MEDSRAAVNVSGLTIIQEHRGWGRFVRQMQVQIAAESAWSRALGQPRILLGERLRLLFSKFAVFTCDVGSEMSGLHVRDLP